MITSTHEKLAPRYEGMKVTREVYLDLEEDGFKYDMIDGVLHLSPSHIADRSYSQGRFFFHLATHLESRKPGRLYPELDILLPDGGDVLRPDICFVLNERLRIVKKHIHGAPDLVVELLSDSTEKRDLTDKAERYLKCGVKEYWIIDPRNKTLRLWINQGEDWEKLEAAELESRLLKGFRVTAKQIFT